MMTSLRTRTRMALIRARFWRRPLATSLLLVGLAWLLVGCSVTTGAGSPTATATAAPTCATALPGSSPIDLQAHGFVYPITYPTGTVGSAISVTASGSGLFTVNEFTACMPGTTVDSVQSFYTTQLPALQHGWYTATLFPADGGLMTACSAPCFWNPKGVDIYYLVFDQFSDHGAGVVTYRGRWAAFALSALPTCSANFGPGNTGAQRQVYFVGSGATAFPVPPLSSIAPDDAAGGIRGYDICSPGTAASVTAFLAKEVPADGWTKVTTSNAHCTIASNCWTKSGQYWSWGAISDPKLWTISYRQ
jgi:hypothetical protein